MNADKLFGKIKEKRLSLNQAADGIGISLSSLRRKMAGDSEFTRDEITKMCSLLELTDEELLLIFFN